MSGEATHALGEALAEQLDRALTEVAGPEALRASERGEFPGKVWRVVEGLGLSVALVPEEKGGAGLGWAELAAPMRVLGRHGAPVPLAEAVLANQLLSAAGLVPAEGLISLMAPEGSCPWGRHAALLLRTTSAGLSLEDVAGLAWHTGHNIGREPRDRPERAGRVLQEAAWDGAAEALSLGGAALRALQIAGAAEAAMAMAVDYANTRKQFGRPIGRFQAVQQLLAQMAASVAACTAASEGAAAAIDRGGLHAAAFEIAVAKVLAGDAAGTVAAIAHQVHGAMGITDEHALHLLTRRLWSWRMEFGSDRFWAERLGQQTIAAGGAALWPALTARGESV